MLILNKILIIQKAKKITANGMQQVVMMLESFKFGFANALLLACESKAVSEESLMHL